MVEPYPPPCRFCREPSAPGLFARFSHTIGERVVHGRVEVCARCWELHKHERHPEGKVPDLYVQRGWWPEDDDEAVRAPTARDPVDPA